MPAWAGRWKGGRYYLDATGRPVYFIERRGRTVRLSTHDLDLALGDLSRFLADPVEFTRPAPTLADTSPLLITEQRRNLYLESIHHTVRDHRRARASYLDDWAALRLDLRTVTRQALRVGLASFDGGHQGRVEALNAFARFLVREGELPGWNPLVSTRAPAETRAEREAYALEDLAVAYARLEGPLRDVFHLRCATGMHHTEIQQLAGARVQTGPLGDRGAAIRTLPAGHAIAGVLQVTHRKKAKIERRHRVSVDGVTLAAALRLVERVPDRITAWEAFAPLVPSNLRHTFVTLAGEIGELVTYKAPGVDRARIQQVVGHRAGSAMTSDRYDKLQVPPMIRLPLPWVPRPEDSAHPGAGRDPA